MSKILKISESLRELLQRIESSSLVAKSILELTKEGHNLPLIENGIDYLSISEADSNRISYVNCDKMSSINECDLWISSKRFHILPGKVVFKLFSDSILKDGILSPKDVEIFSNVYRSCQVENKSKFLVVKGNDIRRYYHHEKYSRNINGDLCGSLGGSCMKHDRCQDYFSIYIDNKEVSLLCLIDKESNSLIGRALLWDIAADEINTGKQFIKIMDRIYTTNDEFYSNMFKNWANKNGYTHKYEQNHSNSVWFEKEGKKIELYLSININTNYKYFPYLDTFKFIDINNSTLYNYPAEGVFRLKIMNSTEGNLNRWEDYCLDEITRIVYHIGDTIELPYLNNIRVFQGNTVNSYCQSLSILKSHAIYNEDLDDYIFNEEYDKFNDKDKIEFVISERKKNIEEINKKREMLKALRVESISLQSEASAYGDDELFDELVAELDQDDLSIRHSRYVSEYAESEPLPLSFENHLTTLEQQQSIGRTRRRPPSRRSSVVASPGISTYENNENRVEPLINEGNAEQSIAENSNYVQETAMLTSWVEHFNSTTRTHSGRIYPTNMTEYIQDLSRQINSQNSSSEDEDSL